MDNAGPWSVFQADAVTPSGAIVAAVDGTIATASGQPGCLSVTVSPAATGHLLQRNVAAVLDGFSELRLWVRSERRADGSSDRPFYWKLRLASVAMDFNALGNTWYRLLPVQQENTWEMVRVSISDLPGAIRSSVTSVRLECIDAGQGFRCRLDEFIAVKPQMVADVETALVDSMHNRVTIAGTAVPAALLNPDAAAAPAPPVFSVIPYEIRRADELARFGETRGDFTDTGFRLWPTPLPYYLFYDVDARVADVSQRAALLDFVLQRFSPMGTLIVNGAPLTAEILAAPPVEPLQPSRFGRTPLRVRVTAAQQSEPEAQASVRPYRNVIVETDQRALRGV